MKNRNGFTLIELLAVVVILGLVILVAVPFFTGSMKVFREDYYKNEEGNVEAAGKEFYSDNRIYLPHKLLDASIVDVNTLLKDQYISNFKDYNGNKCENENSYVIVIKMGRDDYRYETCMKCLDDDYDNTPNNAYCSEAWKDGFTQITFTEAPDVRIYKGTEKNKLKDLIKVYPTISRCSKLDVACNNPLVSISAEGEDGIEPIYPKNIDVVNTNRVGTYEVEYQYENHLDTVKGKVIVFENTISNTISSNDNTDGFYFQKTNNYVRGTITAAPVQETSAYNPDNTNDWAQQYLTITFKYTFDENVTPGLKVTRYQIFFNNRWEDYCTDISGKNNKCVKVEPREMDENVKFRFIDSEGHVSTESRIFNLRIDKTEPSCNLTRKPYDGTNEWYISTVDVTFADRTYPDSSKPFSSARTVNSHELRYGITLGNILATSKDKDTQKDETKSVTWYGYVEDKANNFKTCQTTFRVDLTNPTCSISKHAKLDAADPISELTKVDYRLNSSNILINNAAINPKKPTYQAYKDSTNAVRVQGDWTFSVTEESGRTCSTSSRYCKITYDKDEGETGPTPISWDVKRETELADLTPIARRGKYKMIGWSEDRNTESAYSSYTVKHETTRTLYAVYVLCGKGEYTSDDGTACIRCPGDYVDGDPAANIYGCRMDVSGAHHVKNAKDLTETICSKGQYKGPHSVYYNQTSTCNDCPAGYRDGDPVAEINSCIMSVSGGHYVKNARDSTASTCAAGTARAAHTVNYTATSSCPNCSCGQYSGAGAASCSTCAAGTYSSGEGNSTCTKASKGSYVGSAGSCSQSSCACGSYTNSTGQSSCTSCSAGTYASGEGNTGCTNASKGHYVPSSGQCGQTAVPEGAYQPNGARSDYFNCPSGYPYTGGTGKTSATDCYYGATSYYTKTSKSCGCTSSTSCSHAVYYCQWGEWKLSSNDKPKTCYNTSASCDKTGNTNGNKKETCSCTTTTSCSWGKSSSSDVSSCSSSHPSCTSGATDVSCSDIKYSCPSGGSLSGTSCYYSG